MRKIAILVFCLMFTGTIFVGAGIYGIYTYFQKNPIDREPWDTSALLDSQNWMTEAKVLASISAVSIAAGADEWAAGLLTRAGALLGSHVDIKASQMRPLAQQYLQQGIELSQRVAERSKNYGPLLQARLEYAKLMNRVGEKQKALRHLNDSMDMAKQFSPESKWIQEFQRTIEAVKAK